MTIRTRKATRRESVSPPNMSSAAELGQLAQNRDELLSFCHQNRLHSHLRTAVALAKKCFKPRGIVAHLERDLETGEQWIVIRLTILSNAHDVRDAYRRYTARWTRSVAWPERYLIRISHDLA